MTNAGTKNSVIHTSILPWFTVGNGMKAAEFYKSAFAAQETYRLETPDGLVVKLSVNGVPKNKGGKGYKWLRCGITIC